MKKTSRIFVLIASLLYYSILSYSQPPSCHLRISLLTCSPGEELYSSWGHTAIRVTDKNTGTDMVYNYGTFDDSDPDFYLKFTRGIMHYALSAYPYADFLLEYQYQHRGIVEQDLQLSCEEKIRLDKALQINNTETNRFYSYYFHTDNCTTRARDIVVRNTSGSVAFKNILPQRPVTFRNLIHAYLNNSHQYWSKFGIDLFLGMNLDKRPTNEQAMFLPDYLKKGFDSTLIDQRPLVGNSQIVLPWPQNNDSNLLFTPLIVFTILLLLVSALSFSRKRWAYTTLAVFDSLFFFVIGLLGVLMLILWIIRVDDVCRNNLNILWALPTHVVVGPLLHRERKWVRSYFLVVFWIAIVLAFTWFIIPQEINNAVGPLLLVIIIRSYHYSKKTK